MKLQDTELLHWGRLYTVTVDSYHGLEMYVFVCNLTVYLYYREQPFDCTRKWFLKTENNICFT